MCSMLADNIILVLTRRYQMVKNKVTYKKLSKNLYGVYGAASGTIAKTYKGFDFDVEGPKFVVRGVEKTLLGAKRKIGRKVEMLGGF